MFPYRYGSEKGGVSDFELQYQQKRRKSTSADFLPTTNSSDNCLTIQVPRLYDLENNDVVAQEFRKAHSSPTRHPQRRRYSQGAILDTSSSLSIFSTGVYDVDLLRHSTEKLRDISSTDTNPFSSTIQLMDQESLASGSASVTSSIETRRKVSRTPQERPNKLAKRQWPDDNLMPLDDICESPLVKTPNEPVQWSSFGNSTVAHPSTTSTLFALDNVSATLQTTTVDKGYVFSLSCASPSILSPL